MPAVTTNKQITKPAYNEYATEATGWTNPINLNWDTIDAGFGGVSTLTAVSGTNTLALSEYRNLILQSSAALTGPVTYRIPSGVGGQWIVKNATTGSHAFTVDSAGGGTSVAVPQGQIVTLFSDGTNVALADNPTSTINAILATRDVIAGTGLTGGGPLSADVTLTADFATPLEWRSNTNDKVLEPPAIWSSMTETTLTDAATIAWDMQTGFDFIVVPSTARTLANPTNTKVGQKGRLIIQQPPSGGPGTLTWGSNFKFANGVAPTLSTAADEIDVLYYDVRSSTYIIISLAGRAFA